MQDEQAENAKKLTGLIKGIKIAMMVTADTDGTLRSRPMATQESESDGTLWFFSGKSSHKTIEIDSDHRVNLSYADPGSSRYVSVSGSVRLVEDKAKAKELWNPMFKAWFPQGLEDPDLCLLKVTADKAEYWDTPGSAVVHAIGFVKAIVTGERANPGDHGKLNLKA